VKFTLETDKAITYKVWGKGSALKDAYTQFYYENDSISSKPTASLKGTTG